MSVEVQTGWVVPPPPIRGLDHLGVQAYCIALYGQLVLGIPNVTDRCRYYPSYPSLLWSFERRYSDHSKDEFSRILRRAECLLALISAYHETTLDEDERDHGAATVGRIKLRRRGEAARDGEVTNLEEFARFEGESCYFKNRLGGLGQYYFGPLRDLQIVDYVENDRTLPPGYDRVRGAALAEAFEGAVPSDRFFQVLEDGTVGQAELADLVAFCPCGLKESEAERRLLLDLFFARTDTWPDDGGSTRRASLALLLDLVQQSQAPGMQLEELLRGAAYTGRLADGTAWNVSPNWQRTRDGWGVYARNEILSIALQGLFWAQLRGIEDQGGTIRSTEEAAWFLRDTVSESLGAEYADLTVTSAVERLASSLANVDDWSGNEHEIRRAWRTASLAEAGAPPEEVAKESAILLLSLLVRGLHDDPYQEFDLDPAYFAPAEIHLASLRQKAPEWQDWPLREWASWIGRRWCIERHLHVALRKLRIENRDTFRIRPLDGLLSLVEAPPVVFTSPRIAKAEQILRDLDLLRPRDDWYVLTNAAESILEECRGQ